jgi:hypothetical protein
VKLKDLAEQLEVTEQLEKEVEGFIMEKIVGGPSPQEGPVQVEQGIKVDFRQVESPFRKAEKMEKRLKLFLWGPSGCGKTTLALRFPKPVVIDLERGTEPYGGVVDTASNREFEFDVRQTTNPDEAETLVDWLLTNPHDYRTLIVDPITVYWEALQKKWSDIFLKRNKGGKGYKFEFYDLQPRDWNTIKGEYKEFTRKLLALDMNVIVIARSKVLYEEGAFMKSSGETFDGEKTLPFLFDTHLRLWKTPDGKFMAETVKDRTNRLPQGTFEVSYTLFEEKYGARSIARKATPVRLATQSQKDRIRELSKEFGITEEKLVERLQAYGAESLDDLTKVNADVIIQRMEEALPGAKKSATIVRSEVEVPAAVEEKKAAS